MILLSKQMREFQEQNKDVLVDYNPNARTDGKDDQVLQILCDEDWRNIQKITDQYKQQIEEKDKRIAALLANLQEKKDTHDPSDAQEKSKGSIPWDTAREIISAYQVAWNHLCDEREREKDPESPIAKRLRMTAYDHCLAKVLTLQKAAEGKTADKNVYRLIHKAYHATCRKKKFYVRPRDTRNDTEDAEEFKPVDRLVASWIIRLQERKKQISQIQVKRQKRKTYNANVIRAFP
jgi:hypothetical protein